MKDGARIIIVDTVLPSPGTFPNAKERLLRGIDIQMMVARNSKERTKEDWIDLIEKTDKRLKVKNFAQPPQADDTFIEIVFSAA
jgi:6-hydroxytryprostatin B O-methyltransferase